MCCHCQKNTRGAPPPPKPNTYSACKKKKKECEKRTEKRDISINLVFRSLTILILGCFWAGDWRIEYSLIKIIYPWSNPKWADYDEGLAKFDMLELIKKVNWTD